MRESSNRHSEIKSLLGAYTLDALDTDERRLVEAHLATCESCRGEVEEHRGSISQLAETEMPPPPGLWQKIQGSLEEAPPPLDLATLRSPVPRRRSISLRVTATIAAALAVVVALLGIRVVQQESRIAALEASAGEDGLLRAAAAAAADPRAERITLRSANESLVVDAVLLPDGRGYLVSHNLPPLPSDRTYQLWALVDETRISLGVMDASPGVVAFRAPGIADGLAITEEPAGGVATSRNQPVVVGLRPA